MYCLPYSLKAFFFFNSFCVWATVTSHSFEVPEWPASFFFLGIKIRTVLGFFISFLFRTHFDSDRSIYKIGRLVGVVVVVVVV